MPSDAESERPILVVTGVAGGIGSAVATRFAAGGWNVFGTDCVDASGVDRVADLRRAADCRAVVDAALQRWGRLDCVVNCAGVWTEGPSELTSEEEWDRTIDVNLKGTYFMCSAAIVPLRETRGSIINLSSDAGIQGNRGAAVYCASKGGVTNLTRALALELAPDQVRVNAICPGDVETPMVQRQAVEFGGDDPEGYLRTLLDGYPQGAQARFVRADEVAELAWFLAQPHASAITGANLSIDFGLSAGI